ncbi:MAG: peptidylprolyl isomerase [Hyphomonadaceae bacterium]|nr:peptidylprolyl isomerase [Hyphomonadaceae bacterium]
MKRNDLVFLIAGGAGLIAAFFGAVGAPQVEWVNAPAAIVNGVPIPREALARAVVALDADSRNPVTPEREAEVLQRLIEEELLVQHGVELGLAETDFAARRALVQSVLSLAVAERAGDDASEAELRQFYLDNRGFFAPAQRFSASIVFVRDGADAAQRSAAIRQSLASGADAANLGDPIAIPMPSGALPQAQWTRLIGPEAAAAAARLAPGDVSAPIATAGGHYIVRLNGFIAAPAAPFEDVEEQVRAEWERRADERAARAYIERLERAARIERHIERPPSS